MKKKGSYRGMREGREGEEEGREGIREKRVREGMEE